MSFYYIELDGKTVSEFDGAVDFYNQKGESPNDLPHVERLFSTHPDENSLLNIDPDTGRYVYRYCGKITHF